MTLIPKSFPPQNHVYRSSNSSRFIRKLGVIGKHSLKKSLKIVKIALQALAIAFVHVVSLGICGVMIHFWHKKKVLDLQHSLEQKGGEITYLKRKVEELNHIVKFKEDSITKLREEHHAKITAQSQILEHSGPIASLYTPKFSPTIETEVPSDVIYDAFVINSPCLPEFENISSMETLLEKALEKSFEQLLTFANHINLNRSKQILSHEAYQISIVRNMVLSLIEQASLKKDGCSPPTLILNNTPLTVANSDPIQMVTYQYINNTPMREVYIVYKHIDSWGPSKPTKVENFDPHSKSVNSHDAIEPVSVKWILERLNNKERNILKLGLIHNIIPEKVRGSDDTNPLFNVSKKMEALSSDKKILIEQADTLIRKIANSIVKNFKSHFTSQWVKLCPEDISLPGIEEDEIDDTTQAFVPWNPELKYIPKELQSKLAVTQKHMSVVWSNAITKSLFANPLPRDDEMIRWSTKSSNYFYFLHDSIRNASCLFSALTWSLLQEKTSCANISDYPIFVKRALIGYLENALELVEVNGQKRRKNLQAYSNIARKLNPLLDNRAYNSEKNKTLTLDEYLTGLKDSIESNSQSILNKNEFGNAEIFLFAEVFKIRIEIFSFEALIKTVNGHIIPSQFYGPNTAEKILLYYTGNTFYAVQPNWRESQPTDTPELKESLKFFSDFWKKKY